MINRNSDLDSNKWFIENHSGRVAKANELIQCKLNREIYFSPSYSPLISVKDSSLGSCFQDWSIPSASIDLSTQTACIPALLSVDDYQQKIHSYIKSNIQKIFEKHKRVYLSLSGGIDSVVLLSYLIDMKLNKQTTIVVFENHSQSNSDCLHNNPQRKNTLDALCEHLKDFELEKEIITSTNLAEAINHSFSSAKCYVTYSLMARHQDRAWLFGYHGNQLLLHKEVFLDEILYRSPHKKHLVKQAISQQYFYTQSLKDYQFDRPLRPLHNHHLLLKPWHDLNGLNNNSIYAPLGMDNYSFDLCRSIDFSRVDPTTITDAKVARWLIDCNHQSWLHKYIITESTKDIDNLEHVDIDLDLINPTLLEIPENLNHDPQGLEWLSNQIITAKACGKMPLNTLISLKNLQWLSSL